MGRIIISAVIISLLLSFLPTTSFADENTNAPLRLKDLLQEARTMIQPILEHNSSKLLDRIPQSTTVGSIDKEKAKEKLLNLICNALVHAPAGTEIEADYNADGKTFQLWVYNKAVSQHVKREIVDPTGNAFNIEMFPGSGTLYTMALLP